MKVRLQTKVLTRRRIQSKAGTEGLASQEQSFNWQATSET